jgi:hypothetical protein
MNAGCLKRRELDRDRHASSSMGEVPVASGTASRSDTQV